MVVRYTYLTWTKPKLSEQEELALGRSVHELGRAAFLRRFEQQLREAQCPSQERKKPTWKTWLMLAMLGVGAIWIFAAVPGGPRMFLGILWTLVVVLGLYYGSVLLARWRHRRWLAEMERKYLTHVSRQR